VLRRLPRQKHNGRRRKNNSGRSRKLLWTLGKTALMAMTAMMPRERRAF